MKLVQLIIGAIFLLASSAHADANVVRGHMPPFSREILPSPIYMKCGGIIQEWKGSLITQESIERIETLCLISHRNFFRFIAAKNIKPAHKRPFVWSISLLPKGTCYRCLNDVNYRFYERSEQYPVTGYIDIKSQWIFANSDTDRADFDVTIAHELFHAHSLYYGVFDQHLGQDQWTKRNIDEAWAREFTVQMGLGE